MVRLRLAACCSLTALCFCVTAIAGAQAAENGIGFYLLGSKGPMAAILPPEGVYFQNDVYVYSGDISASRNLPLGGNIAVGVKVQTIADFPTIIWSTPWEILGGKLALTATAPFGGPKVDASVVAGPFSVGQSDRIATFGDPVVSAILGWSAGNFHWSSIQRQMSQSATTATAPWQTSPSIAGRATSRSQARGSIRKAASTCRRRSA